MCSNAPAFESAAGEGATYAEEYRRADAILNFDNALRLVRRVRALSLNIVRA